MKPTTNVLIRVTNIAEPPYKILRTDDFVPITVFPSSQTFVLLAHSLHV